MHNRNIYGKYYSFVLILLALFVPADSRSDQAYAYPRTEIPIAELADFNFKTRAEIFSQRQVAIAAYPQFFPGKNYTPSAAVFGQVQDKKPWWGIMGHSYYGPGMHSIDGVSFQSEFILNPYLLVGLESGHAFIVTDRDLKPEPIYIKPLQLYWNNDGRLAQVIYDVTSYQKLCVRIHARALKYSAKLVGPNARDLGWPFLAISSKESSSVSAHFDQVVTLQDFYHTGGSCKYPGGCNNLSPDQPGLDLAHITPPARLYVKLWKTKPANADMPADMIFVIDMI